MVATLTLSSNCRALIEYPDYRKLFNLPIACNILWTSCMQDRLNIKQLCGLFSLSSSVLVPIIVAASAPLTILILLTRSTHSVLRLFYIVCFLYARSYYFSRRISYNNFLTKGSGGRHNFLMLTIRTQRRM